MNENQKLSYQEQIVESIKNGDLQQFKSLFITKTEINRKLLPLQNLNAFPRINKNEKYTCPKGPTALMYAILCEQDEIFDYIIQSKNPDFTLTSEGYSLLHLAAMVKDSHMIETLLNYSYFQDNVDKGVDFGTISTDLGFTSALHIAVTNHHYLNVYRLLTPFKWPKDVPLTENRPQYLSANVDMKSASGSTALHIAVFLHDVPMIKLLLSFNASRLIENADEKTVLDIINDDKNDPSLSEVRSVLEDVHFIDSHTPLQVMHEIYPENPEFIIENHEEQKKEQEITNLQIYSLLTQILDKVNNLEKRVSRLERIDEYEEEVDEEEEMKAVPYEKTVCQICGNPGNIYPQCNGCYCNVCIQKPQYHSCIK